MIMAISGHMELWELEPHFQALLIIYSTNSLMVMELWAFIYPKLFYIYNHSSPIDHRNHHQPQKGTQSVTKL